ncbi:hypothetical protein COL5a_001669 [Colletotrichum fioriniae]|nr:hypothetical protein COL5a_001669 [Colletotrichum fioriniae]
MRRLHPIFWFASLKCLAAADSWSPPDGPSLYGNGSYATDVLMLAGNETWTNHPDNEDTFGNDTHIFKKRAEDLYLRILPLGASITRGVPSSDNNGYRKALREQLRFEGWEVNMVGSKQDVVTGEPTLFAYFANLGGLSRADLIEVDPAMNAAYTHLNECKGSGGHDGTNDDGSDIAVENLRETRLFRFYQCNSGTFSNIKNGWRDFDRLSLMDSLSSNIDWNSQGINEFFGQGDQKTLSDEKKKQIQNIFYYTSQMWIHWWTDVGPSKLY